jgi:WD40 repeat protein
VEAGSTRFTLTGHKQTIRALAFSPNGKILASGENYQTIYLWDVTTGQQLTNSQTETTANTLQFSPDGKTLIIGGWNGKLHLLDAHTLRLLSTHIGHTNWVNALMFSEDGKTLFSASRDGTILLWDWEKIAQVAN